MVRRYFLPATGLVRETGGSFHRLPHGAQGAQARRGREIPVPEAALPRILPNASKRSEWLKDIDVLLHAATPGANIALFRELGVERGSTRLPPVGVGVDCRVNCTMYGRGSRTLCPIACCERLCTLRHVSYPIH